MAIAVLNNTMVAKIGTEKVPLLIHTYILYITASNNEFAAFKPTEIIDYTNACSQI